jgi:catechol 2,3-dioxygenase-like lactoylglutathione lyase family enzyme
MLDKLTYVNVWVDDQDEALRFYTDKLGMELRDDVTMPELGGFRWLTVGLPGQDVALALMTVPGPPVFDAETQAQIKALLAKGVTGGLFFSTDNCQAAFEELKQRGVEFSRSRRSSRTGSTRASVTRRATRCAWRRCRLVSARGLGRPRRRGGGSSAPPRASGGRE